MKTSFVGIKMLLLAGIMASASFATAAESSGVLVQLGGFLRNQNGKLETTSTSATLDSKESTYDLNLGFLYSSGLYLGVNQSSYQVVTKSDGATTSDKTATATGLSAGYFGTNGLYLRLHYYLSAQYDDYKKGSGTQLELGYMGRVASSFLLGVQLAQQSLTFTENDTIATFEKYTISDLRPMFTMGFIF
jgi:hypothetical protein